MSDVQTAPAPAATDSTRTIAILVYILYLAAFVNGLTAIAGVVLAYVKRADARGTVYESHFSNAIETFWICFGLCVLGALTIWFGLGVLAFIGAAIFFLYRAIKGLVRVIDSKPYVRGHWST